MPDAQTVYEIRLACHKPGCPVCTLVQQAGARYIEALFAESMLDPAVREKLVKSRGFCYDHTWLSINMKLSDALGHAMLYQDLLTDLIKRVDEDTFEGESNSGCPACKIEDESLERVSGSLKSALRMEDFFGEFRHSRGLCLPHLKSILHGLDGKTRAALLQFQRTCVEDLQSELGEFIRKNDYRFSDEAIGQEGDSYKRAADLIKGKHKPEERKDLR